MVNFPTGKMRSVYFPILSAAIGCEDKCAFTRPDKYSNPGGYEGRAAAWAEIEACRARYVPDAG